MESKISILRVPIIIFFYIKRYSNRGIFIFYNDKELSCKKVNKIPDPEEDTIKDIGVYADYLAGRHLWQNNDSNYGIIDF